MAKETTKNNESGTAAKPAETTVQKSGAVSAHGADGTAEQAQLSSGEYASLFSESLELPDPDPKGETEVLAQGAETQTEETLTETDGTEETETGQTEETETGEQTEAEKTEATTEESQELPEHIQQIFDDLKAGKAVKDIAKRIDSVVYEREEAKRQAAAATARATKAEQALQQARSRTAAPGGVDEMDAAQLEVLEKNASQFLEVAGSYLDDTANEKERVKVEAYMKQNGLADERELRRHLKGVDGMVNKAIPQRREELKSFKGQSEKINNVLVKLAPEFFDAEKPDAAELAAVLEAFPALRNTRFDYNYVAMCNVLGRREMDKRAAAFKAKQAKPAATTTKANPNPPKLPPKIPTPNATPAPTVPEKKAKLEKVEERFKKQLRGEDAAALFANSI